MTQVTLPQPFARPAIVSRLQIEVTTGCNLRCAGCQRTIGLEKGEWVSRQMPRTRFQALLRHLPDSRSLILQGIGEPTLHTEIGELIDDAQAAGRFGVLSFNTNALVREVPFYESLRSRGLRHVSVSVDSLDPVIAERLRAGTDVQRLRNNLAGLLRLFPRLTVSVVLSRGNLANLSALVDELAAMGVQVIEVQPLIHYGPGSDALCLQDADSAQARSILSQLRARHPKLSLMSAPALDPNGSRCRRPLHALYVTVDGYLTPCCTTNDVTQFGRVDMTRMSFEQAWQHAGVSRWFNAFIDAEPEICKGCAFNPSGASRPVAAPLQQAIQFQLKGQHPQAESLLRQVAAGPEHVESLHRLGISRLAQGDPQGAIPMLEAARHLGTDPRYPHNLAVALSRAGRAPEAIDLMRQTLVAHRHYLPGHALLAGLLKEAGQDQASVDAMGLWAEQALSAKDRKTLDKALDAISDSGREPANLVVLANLLRVAGLEVPARTLLDKRLAKDPSDIAAGLTRAMTHLAIVHASSSEIEQRRQAYQQDLMAMAAQADRADTATLARSAAVIGRAKPFFLSYQGQDDSALQRVYGQILSRLSQSLPGASSVLSARSGRSRIRIGFASRFFHMHSVSKLFVGWIEQLDRQGFEVYGYHLGASRDAMCERIAKACDHFASGMRPAQAWCQKLLEDELDVLIYPELGMDDTAVQMACQRLAPVQCVAWGHPVTTGLEFIDYFLSSDLMEPQDGASHYTERLVRLPNLSIFYEALPSQGGRLSRLDLGLRASAVVYICCQSLFKYLPEHDHVLTDIASRVPDSQFLFIGEPDAEPTRIFASRVSAAFTQAGLDPRHHLRIQPPVPHEAFPSLLRSGDVYLDSMGWSGGNTTLEAIACELPVITFPTALMRGRHSKAILERIGLSQCIASSPQGFVEQAVALADPAAREPVRAALLAGRDRLYQDLAPVRALEDFLKQALASLAAPSKAPAGSRKTKTREGGAASRRTSPRKTKVNA